MGHCAILCMHTYLYVKMCMCMYICIYVNLYICEFEYEKHFFFLMGADIEGG